MPAIVIAIEDTKGGVGKTNTCVNLAIALQVILKARVLILDRDPLRVIRTWREISGREDYPLVIGLEHKNIHVDIYKIQDGFDFILIDGAAGIEEKAAISVRNADLVVVPVQPSGPDIWGCKPLIKIIKKYQSENNNKPIAKILLNRVKKNTLLAKEIHQALEAIDMPAFKTRISENVLYPTYITRGSSVFDWQNKKAKLLQAEFISLIQEIVELTNGKEKNWVIR